MPRRARYRSPDGLDWRDLDMPVLRTYRMADLSMKIEVDPDYERQYREYQMTQPAPDNIEIERKRK